MVDSGAPDSESYALATTLLLIVAVGLCIAGVILLVSCETSTTLSPFGQTTTTCLFAFQGFGIEFLYAGALTAIGSGAMFFQFRAIRGYRLDWDYRMLFVLVAAVTTIAFVVAMLILGLF
jgi:hypothetical protein